MIEVCNIDFGYKKSAKIFEQFSLTIHSGERFGILGFNGAGKSTLIKMILGIIKPSIGFINIGGKDVWTHRRQIMKSVGVVWGQKTTLWWDIPVLSSYQMLKKIYHISDAHYSSRLQYFNSILNLDSFWERPLRTLSLGQRAKAEIVASLLHGPELLIYDEPFLGLDLINRSNILLFLERYCAENKCTLLLSSHDIEDIDALCDHILLIDSGKVLFSGAKQELRQLYRNLGQIDFFHDQSELIISPELRNKLMDIVRYEHKTRVTYCTDQIDLRQIVEQVVNKNQITGIEANKDVLEQIVRQIMEMKGN